MNLYALEYIFIRVYNYSMNKIQRFSLVCIALVCLIVLFGTAVAFVSGAALPGKNLRRKDPAPQSLEKKVEPDEAVFSQVGTVRCSTADTPSIPIVITMYFRYKKDDTAFHEELRQKTRRIRVIIAEYTGQYTRQQLLEKGEQKLKADLTDLINRELVLGKIDTLYFSDYIFLE